MPVTKTQIERIFNTKNVVQFGSKQLFLVDGRELVSYKTTVGILQTNGIWKFTENYYSKTTSRNINWFKKEFGVK